MFLGSIRFEMDKVDDVVWSVLFVAEGVVVVDVVLALVAVAVAADAFEDVIVVFLVILTEQLFSCIYPSLCKWI